MGMVSNVTVFWSTIEEVDEPDKVLNYLNTGVFFYYENCPPGGFIAIESVLRDDPQHYGPTAGGFRYAFIANKHLDVAAVLRHITAFDWYYPDQVFVLVAQDDADRLDMYRLGDF